MNAAVLQEKDYVRKYWEDIAIKLTVRNSIEKLLTKRNNIRVIDLGCGHGLLYMVEITESSDKCSSYPYKPIHNFAAGISSEKNKP